MTREVSYEGFVEIARSTLDSIYFRRAAIGAAAIAGVAGLFSGSLALAWGSEGRQVVQQNECPTLVGEVGEFYGGTYLGQDRSDVTVALEDGETVNVESGIEFTVMATERMPAVAGADGRTTFSRLFVEFEQEEDGGKEQEVALAQGTIPAAWTTVPEDTVNLVTLCQKEEGVDAR